jgi:hypothetical protein
MCYLTANKDSISDHKSQEAANAASWRKNLMKKFLLPFIDKSFSFSPQKPFQILCERRVSRRDLASSHLHFPNWRRSLNAIRTYFMISGNAFGFPADKYRGSAKVGKVV